MTPDYDKIDLLILQEIESNPGRSIRYYADRVWANSGLLTRGGCDYRIRRLAVGGLTDIEKIGCRLSSVNVTPAGRAVITSGVQA